MKQVFKSKRSKIIAGVAAFLAVATVVGVFVPFARKGSSGSGGTASASPSGSSLSYGLRNEDYAKLYVQVGLKANYMAYDTASLSFIKEEIDGGYAESYSWKNYVAGGAAAKLTNASTWRNMDGGIGYRWYYDSEERPLAACELPFEDMIEEAYRENQLSSKSFELEIVAKFLGLSDATDQAHDVGDDFSDAKAQGDTPFRFGAFHAITYLTRGNSPNYNLASRWFFSNDSYRKHWNTESAGCVLLGRDSAFYDNSIRPDVYAVTMNYNNSAGVAGAPGYKLSYWFEGEEYSALTTTGKYFDNDANPYTDSVSRYTIFNGYPGVIYGVRLYDRHLTEDEKVRNSFVDLLAFYKINVSSILGLDSERREKFLNDCAISADYNNLVMGNTASETMKANRALIENIIWTYWPAN